MVGDELVDVVMHDSAPPRGRRLRDWLREATRPPPDLSVRSDYSGYTGVLLIENNRVIAAMVVETARGRPPPSIPRVPLDVDPYFYDDEELR